MQTVYVLHMVKHTISLTCSFQMAVSLTTGAAENPTLTIVSFAIRQADFMAKQMSEKTI